MKSRSYVFTLNNYEAADVARVDALPCRYMVYGKEVGESGTPHLQGFVMFKSQRHFASVRKALLGAHIESARQPYQAMEYCKKEGDFVERGDPPMSPVVKGQKGKEYWEEQLRLVKEGQMDSVDPKLQITHAKSLDYVRFKHLAKERRPPVPIASEWWYGPTGTGKSREARETYPDAYIKLANKWWDHYEYEEVVLLEDFDINHEKLGYHLKIWADHYTFKAEVKGGTMDIRPKKIIITSNYHPNEIWTDPNTLRPIERRFKIRRFAELAEY